MLHAISELLAKPTAMARNFVADEASYMRRSRGHTRQCSRRRLTAWGLMAPWVRALVPEIFPSEPPDCMSPCVDPECGLLVHEHAGGCRS